MRPGGFDAFVFSFKAAISAVVSFVCFGLLGLPGASWAALSAVIVTQPTLHPSFRASLYRLAANVVGGGIGAVLASIFGGTVLSLAIGVLLTGLVCHFAHLDDGLRAAYAAVVIVMMTQSTSVW